MIVAAQAIPPLLAERKAWLLWRYEAPKGSGPGTKLLKVPYYADRGGGRRRGIQGEPTDRARLTTLAEALKTKARRVADVNDQDWGVGYAILGPDSPVIGLDFDHCVDESGRLDAIVAAAVVGTYSEFSPSGRGVRAFVLRCEAFDPQRDYKSLKKGNLNGGQGGGQGDAAGAFGFEVFAIKGFLTVTGKVTDICDLTADPGVVSTPTAELLRLFGERFWKDGERGRSGKINGHSYELTTVSVGKPPEGLTDEAISELLKWLDPDMGYAEWVRVGMSLHHETGGDARGLDLWDAWSAGGVTYSGTEDLAHRWRGFERPAGEKRITASWLRSEAEKVSRGRAIDDSAFPVVSEQAGSLSEVVGGTASTDGVSGQGQGQGDVAGADPAPLPRFVRDRGGAILPTLSNVVSAVEREDIAGMRIGFDEFKGELTVAAAGSPRNTAGVVCDGWREISDGDVTEVRLALERVGFKSAPKDMVLDAVGRTGEANRYDSAQVWLVNAEQRWDRVARAEQFYQRYFGAADSAYVRAMGAYTWSALAGRVIEPGCQVDIAVILQGDEGIKKTSALRAMLPADDYYVEIDLNKDETEIARLMRGALIVEINELRGLHTRDAEMVKTFVTRRVERWTPKYKEFAVSFKRRSVLFGTTNREDLLLVEARNRRWAPLHVERADIGGIAGVHEQLWAEGAAMFKAGGVVWEPVERLAQAEHKAFTIGGDDEWVEIVGNWLDGRDGFEASTDGADKGARGDKPFTITEVMQGALGFSAKDLQIRHQRRVGDALRLLGYEKKVVWVDGKSCKQWVRKAR